MGSIEYERDVSAARKGPGPGSKAARAEAGR
jgi:hypothetical protein